MVVPFTGSHNYPNYPYFSLSEGSNTLQVRAASFMAVFVCFHLDATPANPVMLTSKSWYESIFSGFMGER